MAHFFNYSFLLSLGQACFLFSPGLRKRHWSFDSRIVRIYLPPQNDDGLPSKYAHHAARRWPAQGQWQAPARFREAAWACFRATVRGHKGTRPVRADPDVCGEWNGGHDGVCGSYRTETRGTWRGTTWGSLPVCMPSVEVCMTGTSCRGG